MRPSSPKTAWGDRSGGGVGAVMPDLRLQRQSYSQPSQPYIAVVTAFSEVSSTVVFIRPIPRRLGHLRGTGQSFPDSG